MKYLAVTITAKERAELVEVAPPAALGPREIRGRTVRTLISPGTELAYNYRGEHFPSFPGYAAVFAAEEWGSEVTGITAGTLLFCTGSHRSFQQVEAQDALAVPDGLAADKAVLARLMGVSMTTLMTTTARPGDRVLVSGAGPVGYLAAHMFAGCGYQVFVVEPDAQRREYLERSGLQAVYPQAPVDDTGLAGTIALVVECSGHEQAVMSAGRLVRKRGELVLVGVPWRRQTDLSAHELLSLVFHKYLVLRSGWEWELPHVSSDFRPHSIFSGFATALRWLADGRIPVEGLITHADPREPQLAYQGLLNRSAQGLFTVFDWTNV